MKIKFIIALNAAALTGSSDFAGEACGSAGMLSCELTHVANPLPNL